MESTDKRRNRSRVGGKKKERERRIKGTEKDEEPQLARSESRRDILERHFRDVGECVCVMMSGQE